MFIKLGLFSSLFCLLSGCVAPEVTAFSRWQREVDKHLENPQNRQTDSLLPTIEAFRSKSNLDAPSSFSKLDVWSASLPAQVGEFVIGREVYNYRYPSIKLLYGYHSWIYPRTINISAIYLGRFTNESRKFDVFMVETYQELLYADGFHTRILSVQPAIRVLDESGYWILAPDNKKAVEFKKQDFGKHFFDFVLIDEYDVTIGNSQMVIQTKDRDFEWHAMLPN